MKKKQTTVLLVFSLLCILFSFLTLKMNLPNLYIFYAPLDTLGVGLRTLSLSSALGNSIAILFYLFLCLLPTLYFTYRVVKKHYRSYDLLLLLITLLLFYSLYYFINPTYLLERFQTITTQSEDVVEKVYPFFKFGLFIFVFLPTSLYLCIRFLNKEAKYNRSHALIRVLQLTILLCCFQMFYLSLTETFTSIHTLPVKQLSTDTLRINIGVISLTYLFENIPNALFLVILLFLKAGAVNLIDRPYHSSNVSYAMKIHTLSKWSLYTMFATTFAQNIVLFATSKHLVNLTFTLSLPIIPLLLALLTLVLAKYFIKNNEIYEENKLVV